MCVGLCLFVCVCAGGILSSPLILVSCVPVGLSVFWTCILLCRCVCSGRCVFSFGALFAVFVVVVNLGLFQIRSLGGRVGCRRQPKSCPCRIPLWVRCNSFRLPSRGSGLDCCVHYGLLLLVGLSRCLSHVLPVGLVGQLVFPICPFLLPFSLVVCTVVGARC